MPKKIVFGQRGSVFLMNIIAMLRSYKWRRRLDNHLIHIALKSMNEGEYSK